ncbi:MAG: SDR family oxidoreductase [Pseudanabaenaceae cyanobacterium bins.68]|nr:SDR family oxidoreductase [Pseudanabaenaceae cyanobacterium bins.68]
MLPTILITGASSGIGKATAKYFLDQGWQVVATMRNPDLAGSTDRLLNLRLDVCDPDSIQLALEQAIAHFGKIDVVVNNAGYGAVGVFEAATPAQVQQQFDTNVFGLMNVTRAVLPYFRQWAGGKLINISSVGGRVTFPIYSLYHSTKWAVEGFSESLQYELQPFNIQVKLIEPGAIKTDFYQRSQTVFNRSDLVAYDRYQERVLAKIQQLENSAPAPLVVAKVIYQAALDPSDRLRYSVGGGVPLLLLLRRLLPQTWFSKFIRGRLS